MAVVHQQWEMNDQMAFLAVQRYELCRGVRDFRDFRGFHTNVLFLAVFPQLVETQQCINRAYFAISLN